MNNKITNLCIPPEYSILEAIKVLDETHERIVLIVQEEMLLGVLTDSDVRKCILKKQDMTEKVTSVMTKNPVCVTEEEVFRAMSLMERHGIDAIPVISRCGILLDLLFRYETPEKKGIPVTRSVHRWLLWQEGREPVCSPIRRCCLSR